MYQAMSKIPIIVCCDSLKEQSRISAILAQDFDAILGCQLAQFDALITQHPNSFVVVGWRQPCAELTLLIERCREKKMPLLVIVQSLSSMDINRLPKKVDYVLLPSDSGCSLAPWALHAASVRQSMLDMEQEMAELASKLEERKWIEKAKGLLMKHHGVDESAAYKAMRQSAMQSSQSMVQVAKNVLITLETLKG